MNLDVVESAKLILQVRQTSLKTPQTLLRGLTGKQVPEKIACIAELLDRDPQLVAMWGIKLSNPFCFLHQLLVTPGESVRSEPFDG